MPSTAAIVFNAVLPDSSPHPEPGPKSPFAEAPSSWFYLGTVAELKRGPKRLDLPGGQSFVGFHTGEQVAVLSARCSHMEADLSRGTVRNGCLVCPLHGWAYAADGRCVAIPSSASIPPFARQASFPVAICGGHVFFFNRERARFPFPFFASISAQELVPARPFDFCDDVSWYLVSANGFDRQHFSLTHDRQMLAEPILDDPHPLARSIRWKLRICGTSLLDRITRLLAGIESEMTITSWGGSLVLATARFRRTTTYGLVAVHPLPTGGTHCYVIVWVRRSRWTLLRWCFDPLHAAFRRRFIEAFFADDIGKLTGTRYLPGRMIEADKTLAEYLRWLQDAHAESPAEVL